MWTSSSVPGCPSPRRGLCPPPAESGETWSLEDAEAAESHVQKGRRGPALSPSTVPAGLCDTTALPWGDLGPQVARAALSPRKHFILLSRSPRPRVSQKPAAETPGTGPPARRPARTRLQLACADLAVAARAQGPGPAGYRGEDVPQAPGPAVAWDRWPCSAPRESGNTGSPRQIRVPGTSGALWGLGPSSNLLCVFRVHSAVAHGFRGTRGDPRALLPEPFLFFKRSEKETR